jgi:hypothetical protein
MFRKMIFTVVALALTMMPAHAQNLPYPRVVPGPVQPPSNQIGYWVQFRQPYWRQQQFASEPEMANFIATQTALGWEVQVLPAPPGVYLVRYRLMQWGGSRILPTAAEAQRWAATLEDQGYEPRIVNLSL